MSFFNWLTILMPLYNNWLAILMLCTTIDLPSVWCLVQQLTCNKCFCDDFESMACSNGLISFVSRSEMRSRTHPRSSRSLLNTSPSILYTMCVCGYRTWYLWRLLRVTNQMESLCIALLYPASPHVPSLHSCRLNQILRLLSRYGSQLVCCSLSNGYKLVIYKENLMINCIEICQENGMEQSDVPAQYWHTFIPIERNVNLVLLLALWVEWISLIIQNICQQDRKWSVCYLSSTVKLLYISKSNGPE